MRRLFLFSGMLAYTILQAQNVQVHYDFGNEKQERNYVTTTIEQFKPDKYGSTFFFVDFDYNLDKGKMSTAYVEFARNLKFWEPNLMLHVEYNGGLILGKDENEYTGPLENAWLAGVAYSFNMGKGAFEAQLNYKQIYGQNNPNGQFTFVWFYPFFNNKLSFTGFADFWTSDKFGESGKKMVFLSEPQLWFNINKSFAVGGEVELSQNFLTEDFLVCPTLGAKWTF